VLSPPFKNDTLNFYLSSYLSSYLRVTSKCCLLVK
jgi:hypothetical protein